MDKNIKPVDEDMKPSHDLKKPSEQKKYSYEDLLRIVGKLRAQDGCPWDRAQTHESLKTCLLEEAYETVEAINLKDDENLKEELGDVLLQVVMHAQIAKEENRFDIDDVVDGVAKKMIRRHPHIFGTAQASSPEAVADSWEAIKQQEKKEGSVYESLCHIPKALPANMRARKVLKKAAAGGYNFTEEKPVNDQVRQAFKTLETAVSSGNQEQIDESFGWLIFDLINLSRFLDVNVENSLTNVIEKFINRLGSVENPGKSQGLSPSGLSPQLFKALWDL